MYKCAFITNNRMVQLLLETDQVFTFILLIFYDGQTIIKETFSAELTESTDPPSHSISTPISSHSTISKQSASSISIDNDNNSNKDGENDKETKEIDEEDILLPHFDMRGLTKIRQRHYQRQKLMNAATVISKRGNSSDELLIPLKRPSRPKKKETKTTTPTHHSPPPDQHRPRRYIYNKYKKAKSKSKTKTKNTYNNNSNTTTTTNTNNNNSESSDEDGTTDPPTSSSMWKHFTRNEERTKAKCNLCTNTSKEFKTKTGNTSACRRHLFSVHHFKEFAPAGGMNAQLSITPLEKRELNQLCIEGIIEDGRAFGDLRRSGMMKIINGLCPGFRPPHRNTVQRSLKRLYNNKRSALKQQLKLVPNLCITTDFWSDKRAKSYLGKHE
ncbi:unnamed protein product [Didymodactylos carnosus]|uniref:BED-type domain-containing protein n=1 Tax=Didymodactylos carnosus TaxID=1234261 RepID=A0A8S2KP65_9BILA|nr:unnamed protein product [Didymodactylos carnosus]CAF3862485.1 unnamed protein product [Didymodactylos carnosus]